MKKEIIAISLFFFSFACIFVIRLIPDNLLVATAEEGIPFYNVERTFNLYRNIWVDRDIGIASPFYYPRLPLYGFFFLLGRVGLEQTIMQRALFTLLIGTALTSTYVLSKKLTESREVAILSSIFYFLNLFVLSQVFARFLYPTFFLWAYLPLFLYLWIEWIDTRSKKYLLLFVVTNFIFSDVFGITASVLALWIPAVIYIPFSQSKKRLIDAIWGLCLWAVSNIWWIYPMFVLKNGAYSAFTKESNNITSLIEVSNFYPTSLIMLLKQSFYFGETGFWSEYYSQSFIQDLSIIVFLIMLSGIILSRKLKYWKYVLCLFVVSWFLIKGSNPPLGNEFYSWLFSALPPTQILRNPYEKLGLVFVLIYSLYVGLGLFYLLKKLRFLRFIFYGIFLYYCCYILVMPLWNKEVFHGYYIQVPDHYELINELISKDNSDGRILQMPFLQTSHVQYSWGYKGNEPSEYLYSLPSIAKPFHIPSIDAFYATLSTNLDNENIGNIFPIMNVCYVIEHKDILSGSAYIQGNLAQWDGIDLNAELDSVNAYFVDKQKCLGRVFLSGGLKTVEKIEDMFNNVLSNEFDPQKTSFLVLDQNEGIVDQFEYSYLPIYSVKKLSASRYKISIFQAEKPFVLILSNTYDDLWNAAIDGNMVQTHFNANGYANGWLIDKPGSYTIDIIFKVWPWE